MDVSEGQQGFSLISCDLDALLGGMRRRHSSKPMDKMYAIAFPFMKCNYVNGLYMTLPIYDSSTPASVAWEKLISSLASTKMSFSETALVVYRDESQSILPNSFPYTATTQLLCLFPHPSKHHWFPSWSQIQQYPNVSVRDSDPSQAASGMDYSLRIMSGRIYQGCSLQLITPHTPDTKAIYCSTMDGKDAQLMATVPGIELDIDSKNNYVLIDISPDFSLWPRNIDNTCIFDDEGHEHLPVWPKSVIIVCEEVDTLALECPSLVMKYHLRRVTTLEWECRQPGKPGPGCWLPFEPSLQHMRSVVCRAKGGEFLDSLDNEGKYFSENEDSDSSDNEGSDSSVNYGMDIDSSDSSVNDGMDIHSPDSSVNDGMDIHSSDSSVNDDMDINSSDSSVNDGMDIHSSDSSVNDGMDIDSSDDEDIDLNVFCNPVHVLVATLLSLEPSQWPRYEVYLV